MIHGPTWEGMSPRNGYPRPGGFTLIELLTVVALVIFLAMLAMPAFTKTTARTLGMTCLNNMRQLTAAWKMYAVDNNDMLPANVGTASSAQGWVKGVENWGFTADNTNSALLTQGLIGPYTLNNLQIYHCPADTSAGFGQGLRVRSVSMNVCVGNRADIGGSPTYVNFVQFIRMSDFGNPAGNFVFLDEHPDSINDGICFILVSGANTTTWADLPAAYHNGSGSFSFADGHAEFHEWLNPSTRRPIMKNSFVPLSLGAGPYDDILWVVQRMSVSH